MITYQYTQKDWTTFKEGIKREWAVTNGIGGYAGSSMIGAHSRTHQGYLIASLHAPIERYLVFSKINETATVGTSTVSFETSQHCASGKTVYTEGQKFLTSFIYDGSVHYTYETDNFSFEKHITLKRNANVCAVAYELTAGDSDCTFTLTPLFNYREHSESSTPDTLKFETFTEDRTFYLVPEKNKDIAIRFQTSEGTFSERETVYDIDMQLQIEVDLETDGLDCHYCPVDLSIAVPANTTKKVSILCSIGDVNERPAPVSGTEAFSILEENARCHAELFEKAGIEKHLFEKPKKYTVSEPVYYLNGKTSLVILPADDLYISYAVNYDHPDLTKRWEAYNPKTKQEIIEARTFGFYKDLKKFQMLGFAQGVTLENTLGLKDVGFTSDLRSENEPVKHKILDLIGDLYLTGVNPLNLKCQILVKEAGHAVHVKVAKMLKGKLIESK